MPDLAGRFAAGGPAAGRPSRTGTSDEVHDVYRELAARSATRYDGDRVFVAEVVGGDARAARPLPAPRRAAHGVQLRLPARAVGRRRRCARRSTRASTRSSTVGAPPTWVLSNHDVDPPRHPLRRRRARPAPGPGGGAADARPARRRLRLPGRGARPARGRSTCPTSCARTRRSSAPAAQRTGRDGCRVPLPWSGDEPPFGFGPGPADVAAAAGRVGRRSTVERQEADPASMLSLYRAGARACAAELAGARRRHAGVARRRRRRRSPSAASPGSRASSTSATTTVALPDELAAPERVVLASEPLTDHGDPGATTVWLDVLIERAMFAVSVPSGRWRGRRRRSRGPRSPTSAASRGPARWRRSTRRRAPSRRRCTARRARRRPCWRRSTRRCRSSTTRCRGRRRPRPRPRRPPGRRRATARRCRLDDLVTGVGRCRSTASVTAVTSSVPTAMRTSGLGVVLDQVLDDLAVDGVDEHEPAPARRVLDRVAQHPPRRPAAQPAPHLLRRGVADREADRLLGARPAPRARRRASATPT